MCEEDAVKWISVAFGDCVYTPRDQLSFWVGMVSNVIWVVSAVPQYYRNCVAKNVDGQSPFFASLIFLGNLLSLVGVVVTHGLPTQIITSVLYVILDGLLFLQWVLFRFFCRHELKDDRNGDRKDELVNDNLDDLKEVSTNTASTNSDVVKSENGTNTSIDNNVDTGNVGNVGALMMFVAKAAATTNSATKAATKAATTTSTTSSSLFMSFYSAFSSLFMSFYSLFMSFSSTFSSLFMSFSAAASLSSASEKMDYSIPYRGGNLVGSLFGWAGTAIYVGSRVPQVIENFRRGVVDSFSALYMLFMVLGNLTYALSIFIRSIDEDFLWMQAPFIVGALFPMSCDFITLVQILIGKCGRRQKGYKEENNEENNEERQQEKEIKENEEFEKKGRKNSGTLSSDQEDREIAEI